MVSGLEGGSTVYRARSPIKRRSRTPSPRTRAKERQEREAQRKEKEREDSLREEESFEARQLQRKHRAREKAYKDVRPPHSASHKLSTSIELKCVSLCCV